jgi:hypothetical protein
MDQTQSCDDKKEMTMDYAREDWLQIARDYYALGDNIAAIRALCECHGTHGYDDERIVDTIFIIAGGPDGTFTPNFDDCLNK